MTPFDPFFLSVFLLFFLSVGDERLCFARFFKEPMILSHSCEKTSGVLNDADFKIHKIGQKSVCSDLILTKYFVKSSHFR